MPWAPAAFQIFTVLSQLALAMCLPSGLNATLETAFVCPLRDRTSWPLATVHTFTSWSSPPLTARRRAW